MSKVVERVRHRFAEKIIDLLLEDLNDHGVVLEDLTAARQPGDDKVVLQTDAQIRERWHQIFKDWHSRDRDPQEMKSEQDQICSRMMMAVCLMEVFLEMDNAGLDSGRKNSFSLVLENPDGTCTLNSMFDAVPFLRDLKALVDVPAEFDAKKVTERVSSLGDMSSFKTLGLLGSLCQDQIQQMLGLPRDPDMVEMVEDLLSLRETT